MKKFLKDLEKELNRLKISKEEISEIIADHKEMLAEALNEGLTDEEITDKFGDPEQLAKDLHNDLSNKTDEQQETNSDKELVGYDKFKSFEVVNGLTEVSISVISEDVKVYTYEGSAIEVYFQNVKDPEKFDIALVDSAFTFKRNRMNTKIFFRTREENIIIRLPKVEKLKSYSVNSVSGDIGIQSVAAEEFKIKSTSGDFDILNVKTGKAELTTVSGDFEVEGIKAESLFMSSVSGDFEVKKVRVKKDVTLNTVSGDFEIFDLEADTASLRTVSGDLEGEEFYVGSVDLKSVSGDITIENRDKTRPIKIGKKRTLSGDINIQ